MPKVVFATQSSRVADAANYSSERLINLYAEIGPQGAKGPMLLRSVPGRSSFVTLTVPIVRRMEFVNGNIYAASGGRLWSVSEGGVVSNLAAIEDDEVTTISENLTNVTVCSGGNYYLWTGAAISQPGSGRFTSEGTVEHLDHYTLITEKDGDEFEWTTLSDPATRVATNFATNESNNDDTLRVIVSKLYAYFLGKETTEVWYNTGEANADAFTRLSGGALDQGLLAANLVTKTETGLFLVGNDKVAYLNQSGMFKAVSTGAVNEAIDDETPSHCFYYEERGHRFCCVRFSGKPAWCYDMSTGLWHERSSGTTLGAWDVIDTVGAWNRWYCATTDGPIYKMGRDNTEVTDVLMRRAVSNSIVLDGTQFSVSEVEILGLFGESTLGRDAQIVFRISRDGGRTFGPESTYNAGDLGDRTLRVVLRALGSYRDFCIELTITDAADISIYSQANVKIS